MTHALALSGGGGEGRQRRTSEEKQPDSPAVCNSSHPPVTWQKREGDGKEKGRKKKGLQQSVSLLIKTEFLDGLVLLFVNNLSITTERTGFKVHLEKFPP